MPAWALVAAACASWTERARAEPEEAVRFQYEAPAECPNAVELEARVRARTARGRGAEPGELARTFSLRIRADEQGYLGSVELLDDNGTRVSRQVRGEQCDAVVSSLALITALALDASLREEPLPDEISAPRSQPAQPQPVLEPAAPVTAREPDVAPRRAPPEGLRARVGASGSYASAIGAWTYGLLGQIEWANGFQLRLTGHYATSERADDTGRRASLRLLGLRSSGCFVALRSRVLALAPCAQLDFGTLRGRGIESATLPRAWGDTALWLGVGPELHLAWEPSPSFWLELGGDVQFPLRQYDFDFELPRRTVYGVPFVAASLGVATGVRF